MRLMLGVVFMFHGAQKLFGAFDGPGLEGAAGFFETLGIPLPFASAVLAALTEFGGGLLLITGVAARLMAVPLTFTMLVASFTAHGGAFAAQAGGMEYPLTLAVMSAVVALTGPGAFVIPLGGKRAEAPALAA